MRGVIEFSTRLFVYQLEQNTGRDSDCTLKVFDKDYNLLGIGIVPIKLLSEFLLNTAKYDKRRKG